MSNYLFTSESVTEGHPDKVADQISDAILDAIIKEDPKCRVACETLVTTGLVMVAGEITTSCYVPIPEIVRETIRQIGYVDPKIGFDWETCAVITSIDKQNIEIKMGVDKEKIEDQGAGDQGLMFGYACDETPELMPMPISLAHKLTRRLAEVRKKGILDFLRPDGKSQITVEYDGATPVRIDSIVLAAQHNPDVSLLTIQESLTEEVIKKVIPINLMDRETKIYINGTGKFVIGGPRGDCGVTGRKIIVDTYGGYARHGGGCFSGKDPSKVDRSGSYMARHIAKNIVAAGFARKVEVQIAYVIGVSKPVSLFIDAQNTWLENPDKITKLINEYFDLSPWAIIKYLDLLKPIYKNTASGGHFGRNEPGFTWEKTDVAEELKKLIR